MLNEKNCNFDCTATASCRNPEQFGPMLTQADAIVLTKIDMVSQAEREIISYYITRANPNALQFPVDGLAGYGFQMPDLEWLEKMPAEAFYDFYCDQLEAARKP